MKIAYNGFWPNFNINNNWFNYMFMQYFSDSSIEFSSQAEGADVVVNSVFGSPYLNAPITIFFTGESRKSGYTDGQILLGFDRTDEGSKIFRLPLWYTYINWWPDKFFPEQLVGDPKYILDMNELMSPTNKTVEDFMGRKMFCSMVVTNATDIRMSAYQSLSNIDRVDGYGMMFNNYYTGNKMDILRNYKFNICFENTLSDGYVTEKLFEARLSGCIPVYWGDNMSHDDFNPRCFIDFTSMDSYEQLQDRVSKIYSSDQAMVEMISEPMFISTPSLDPLYSFFDKVGMR